MKRNHTVYRFKSLSVLAKYIEDQSAKAENYLGSPPKKLSVRKIVYLSGMVNAYRRIANVLRHTVLEDTHELQ